MVEMLEKILEKLENMEDENKRTEDKLDGL